MAHSNVQKRIKAREGMISRLTTLNQKSPDPERERVINNLKALNAEASASTQTEQR